MLIANVCRCHGVDVLPPPTRSLYLSHGVDVIPPPTRSLSLSHGVDVLPPPTRSLSLFFSLFFLAPVDSLTRSCIHAVAFTPSQMSRSSRTRRTCTRSAAPSPPGRRWCRSASTRSGRSRWSSHWTWQRCVALVAVVLFFKKLVLAVSFKSSRCLHQARRAAPRFSAILW